MQLRGGWLQDVFSSMCNVLKGQKSQPLLAQWESLLHRPLYKSLIFKRILPCSSVFQHDDIFNRRCRVLAGLLLSKFQWSPINWDILMHVKNLQIYIVYVVKNLKMDFYLYFFLLCKNTNIFSGLLFYVPWF